MTEARPEVVIVRTAVRCSQILKEDHGKGKPKGSTCGQLLVLVDVQRWEEALTDAIAGFCERCGAPYNLGDYR